MTARELQVLWLITGLAGGPAAAAGRPDSSSLEVMDRTAVRAQRWAAMGLLMGVVAMGRSADVFLGVRVVWWAAQVGALLGVSRQAASQVIDRALGKLKAACAADARLVRELQELCAGHDEAN